MCYYISKSLSKKFGFVLTYPSKIKFFIPSFTFQNVEELSVKYNFAHPTKMLYWWYITDCDNRLRCFDALIVELYKKISK